MQQREIPSLVSPGEVALGLNGNLVSCGSQCGPALLSILNGKGGSWRDSGSTGPSPDLWHHHRKQDLNSRDLLRGAPPVPNSQGRGAVAGGVGAPAPVTEPPLEQPRPGRAPSPICFLPARLLRRQPADGRPTACTSLFVIPWQAEHYALSRPAPAMPAARRAGPWLR